jgi:hypothetical protein
MIADNPHHSDAVRGLPARQPQLLPHQPIGRCSSSASGGLGRPAPGSEVPWNPAASTAGCVSCQRTGGGLGRCSPRPAQFPRRSAPSPAHARMDHPSAQSSDLTVGPLRPGRLAPRSLMDCVDDSRSGRPPGERGRPDGTFPCHPSHPPVNLPAPRPRFATSDPPALPTTADRSSGPSPIPLIRR